MNQPTLSTIKRLFAVSGNICAFPKCSNLLIDKITGTVIGEICHIKGRRPGAPRYDSSQSNEERHGYNNLLLMCPIHHKITDEHPGLYTVEELQRIKVEHEIIHSEGYILTDYEAISFLIELNLPLVRYDYKSVMRVMLGPSHLSYDSLKNIVLASIILCTVLIYGTSYFLNVSLSESPRFGVPVLVLIGIILFLFRISETIHRTKFFRFLGINIIADNENQERLYLASIQGECPICGDNILLHDIGKSPDRTTVGMCVRNPSQHTFTFDYTTMIGVPCEITHQK